MDDKDTFVTKKYIFSIFWAVVAARQQIIFEKLQSGYNAEFYADFTAVENCKVYLEPLSQKFQGNLQFFHFHSCSKIFLVITCF